MAVAAEPRPKGPQRERGRLGATLAAPGWWRALLGTLVAAAAGTGLVVLGRLLYGFDPLVDGDAVTTVVLITAPLGFLVGIGCLDYWFRYATAAPTVP